MATVVDWRVSVGLVGSVVKYLSVAFLVPLLAAQFYGNDPVPFLATIGVALVVGFGLEQLQGEGDLGHREAFLLVSLTWIAVPILGTLPYLIAGVGTVADPINALFESMSGFTTTGATLLGDISVQRHGHAMMLYRQLTQWLGGMGILVLMVAILPELSVGGARLISEEAPGVGVDKLRPRIQETARVLWLIYLGFTVLAALVYFGLDVAGLADNMGPYNAIAHALSTLPTGGFSPEARSVEAFSPAVQWAVIVFMIVAGTNFALFWYVLVGEPERLSNNSEFRSYLAVMVAVSALLAALLFTGLGLATRPDIPVIPGDLEHAVRQAVFQVVAIVTTTGYASMDFNTWSESAQGVLLLAMFLGGSAGSAAGSIKIIRWYVVARSTRRELFTTVHPEAVSPIRSSTGVIDEQTLRGLVVFVLVFLAIFAVATVVILVEGVTNPRFETPLSALEAMSTAIATLGNVGPGFGRVGPMDSYLKFSDPAKLFMVFLMWIGRLEILSVLVILTPNYWRR